ncbi:hypothetical protein HOK51_00130 [Candidatus Woesearchaeota archaeon]|jgi:hypothetical protein|nr:hypothetical protein [Candidatus Woesearchaeota archaeon]MBT6518219.1 hypothetical protein [Candidatus Woesearchaeota archaeon]MBT7368512.1 hypothetical protein [Candidatus Woesearchaeota archaeon]
MNRTLLRNANRGWNVVQSKKFNAGEKGLQSFIEQNMDVLLGIDFVGSEKRLGKLGRLDSVGIKDGRLTLFEYKEDDGRHDEFAKHIVNQGLHYVVSARNNFQEFKEYVRHESGKNLDPDLIPMICLVAKNFHTFDKSIIEAVNHQQIVKLKEYDLFGNRDNEGFFYIGDVVTPNDFKDVKIPFPDIDLDDLLVRESGGFDAYLLKRPGRAKEFIERVIKHLYSHMEQPRESKFVKISNGRAVSLQQMVCDVDQIREIVEQKSNLLFGADYVGSDMSIGMGSVENIDTVCINPDGRLVLIDYVFGDSNVSNSLLKASWAASNHPVVQDFVRKNSNRTVNWGYDIDLIVVGEQFTQRQKHLSDLNCSGIRSRLVRADMYESPEEQVVLFDREVTKSDLETYVGAMPAYGLEEYVSRLNSESSQNALRYLVGELRDISDEISLSTNKYGYGARSNTVFCNLRITGGDAFNVKIKVGNNFNDFAGICSGKTGDGYVRVSIDGTDLGVVKSTLGYIRRAFNLDTKKR